MGVYMKVDGLAGGFNRDSHKKFGKGTDYFVLDYFWMKGNVNNAGSSSQGTGKRVYENSEFRTQISAITPLLFQGMVDGKKFAKAEVVVTLPDPDGRDKDQNESPHITYEFTNLKIVGVEDDVQQSTEGVPFWGTYQFTFDKCVIKGTDVHNKKNTEGQDTLVSV